MIKIIHFIISLSKLLWASFLTCYSDCSDFISASVMRSPMILQVLFALFSLESHNLVICCYLIMSFSHWLVNGGIQFWVMSHGVFLGLVRWFCLFMRLFFWLNLILWYHSPKLIGSRSWYWLKSLKLDLVPDSFRHMIFTRHYCFLPWWYRRHLCIHLIAWKGFFIWGRIFILKISWCFRGS